MVQDGEATTSTQQNNSEVEKAGGRLGEVVVSAIHGANVGLLYSVLTIDWLFDLKGGKRADGKKEETTSLANTVRKGWAETTHKGRRFLDLSWRFGEYDASRAKGKSKSAWLTLHTSPLLDGEGRRSYKGKERYYSMNSTIPRCNLHLCWLRFDSRICVPGYGRVDRTIGRGLLRAR